MLQVNHLHAGYGSSIVVRDVTLESKPGEVVCLIGRNGVGKTTLMKSIMGLLKVQKGTIKVNGVEIQHWSTDKRVQKGEIGYIPQGREIFPYLSVYENLILGIHSRKESKLEEAYQLFPSLKGWISKKGGDLSGGGQQQLAIARVMLMKPKILLFDEPTEGLQPSIVKEIEEFIINIKREKKIAVLLVEQKLEFVRKIADRFYVMEKGMIVSSGDIEEMNDELILQYLAV
ncbi:MAG: urea ABC transporter ATP-binding subunit UrtE [Thermicanus sp.]|nr:urea ABC transporter ATP-binding subunit UrtE [Thermicanus sp.]